MVYVELFKKFGWQQVAMLAEPAEEFPKYNSFLRHTLYANGIAVPFDRKMPRPVTMDDAREVRDL